MTKILSLAVLAAVALALAPPLPSQAATADSILANSKASREEANKKARASGCKMKRTCVSWSTNAPPGGLFGKCTRHVYRWDCPIKLH